MLSRVLLIAGCLLAGVASAQTVVPAVPGANVNLLYDRLVQPGQRVGAWNSYSSNGNTYFYQPNADGTVNIIIQGKDPVSRAPVRTAPSTYTILPGRAGIVPVRPPGAALGAPVASQPQALSPSTQAQPQTGVPPAAAVPRIMTQSPNAAESQTQKAMDAQAQMMMQSDMQRTLTANPQIRQNPQAMQGMAIDQQMTLKPQLAPAIMANPEMQKSLDAMQSATAKPPAAQPAPKNPKQP